MSIPSFVQAVVVFCMSASGAPHPPWMQCHMVQSDVVPFEALPGEATATTMAHLCRKAIQQPLHQWAMMNAPGYEWWLTNVDCRPIFPGQMG